MLQLRPSAAKNKYFKNVKITLFIHDDFFFRQLTNLCFPDRSVDKESACKKKKKESACNVGDPSLIPGLGRSPGEGIGYPLQYS